MSSTLHMHWAIMDILSMFSGMTSGIQMQEPRGHTQPPDYVSLEDDFAVLLDLKTLFLQMQIIAGLEAPV